MTFNTLPVNGAPLNGVGALTATGTAAVASFTARTGSATGGGVIVVGTAATAAFSGLSGDVLPGPVVAVATAARAAWRAVTPPYPVPPRAPQSVAVAFELSCEVTVDAVLVTGYDRTAPIDREIAEVFAVEPAGAR